MRTQENRDGARVLPAPRVWQISSITHEPLELGCTTQNHPSFTKEIKQLTVSRQWKQTAIQKWLHVPHCCQGLLSSSSAAVMLKLAATRPFQPGWEPLPLLRQKWLYTLEHQSADLHLCFLSPKPIFCLLPAGAGGWAVPAGWELLPVWLARY